jgi:hypothetical protein
MFNQAIVRGLLGLGLVFGGVGQAIGAVQWSGNGHWYDAVVVPNGVSWADAKTLAENQGGYLATITSAAENDFVFSLISSNTDIWAQGTNGFFYGPFLGGYQFDDQAEPSGHWQWVTGEPWEYTNWTAGQPDNEWGGTQDRLGFGGSVGSNGLPQFSTWDDYRIAADNVKGYIVESTATVPEPASFVIWSLFGLIGGFVAWRKRKQ